MAMYRGLFRDSVIAELMPPLLSDGRSRLWEHLGRRFTGLSYQEADKLSHDNKEFIISLFPQDIQASLLPDDVQELIGEVGEDTKGVKRMLENVGFEYSHRIDPFDGGPPLRVQDRRHHGGQGEPPLPGRQGAAQRPRRSSGVGPTAPRGRDPGAPGRGPSGTRPSAFGPWWPRSALTATSWCCRRAPRSC
jgi:hypothetical protein